MINLTYSGPGVIWIPTMKPLDKISPVSKTRSPIRAPDLCNNPIRDDRSARHHDSFWFGVSHVETPLRWREPKRLDPAARRPP
jgi:hypothetical protein